MVKDPIFLYRLGAPRTFSPLDEETLGRRYLRRNTERAYGVRDDRKRVSLGKRLSGSDKREIEIAQVVEYGPAATEAAGDGDILFSAGCGVTLLPDILMLAHHDRIMALPQVEEMGIERAVFEKIVLDGDVVENISEIAEVDDAAGH